MAKEEEQYQKIGAGHLSAMARQGLAELRGALYQDSSVAQPTMYGIVGTKPPGEVMEERRGESRDPDENPSILDERLNQIEQEAIEPQLDQPEIEPPQHERD